MRHNAEPLVLLPGMMCDARLFAPQIAAFSQERSVHVAPIIAHDTVEALASEVLANAPPRFALAGLSMGGIVAMEIVRQAPDRVRKLCLMDTNASAETDAVKAAREPQIVAAKAGQLRSVMRDEMKPRYLTDGPKRQEILDLCMDMALGLGPDVFVRQSRALQTRPDQRETLLHVSVSTLILCGKDDTLCPLDRHILMRDLIPDAQLEIIESAGHLPTLENEVSANNAMRKWLNS